MGNPSGFCILGSGLGVGGLQAFTMHGEKIKEAKRH